MLQTLLRNLEPKSLFPSLTTGFAVGIQKAILALAIAVMIFSGDLAPYIATGITILLLGNIIHSVIVALGSSLPGTITAVRDSPAVIIAIVATVMLASMPEAGPETKFYTVLAATIAIYYATQAATNTPVAEAARAGWLVSGMPQGETLFRLWNPLGFAWVGWGVLIGQAGSLLRLRSLGPGNFLGEMGIHTGKPASENVIAGQPTRLYKLRAEDLAHLEQAAPAVAAALHRFVAAYMSERSAKTTTTLQALLQ